jgi:hypothetical protein
MAQTVEYLLYKCKALSSNPSDQKKKKGKKRTEKERIDLYNENYKSLKRLEKTSEDGKTSHAHGCEE